MPLRRAVLWGGRWSGGPAPRGGASHDTEPPNSLASVVRVVTCAAACVGAWAVAVAGFAGGSASG